MNSRGLATGRFAGSEALKHSAPHSRWGGFMDEAGLKPQGCACARASTVFELGY
jgi:hypothetical protein